MSYRIWRYLLDGRADAPGSTIWIDSQPFVVAGVMPESFWFSTMDSVVWAPLAPDAAASEPALEVVARRPPEVTPPRLEQQLQAGLAQYTAHLPADRRQIASHVSGIEGTPLGRSVALVLPWLLGAAVLLTLLIACANVAILVIAQWTAREHEIAIRASLGASRGRVVRALLTEAVLMAAMGGVLGVAAALALRGLIVYRAGPVVAFFDLSIDPVIFLQAAAVTMAAGVLSGIGPALLETRRLHGNPMRSIASSERIRQRWRHALVVLEISVTVALLVVTATMLDGYKRSLTTELGFNPHPLVTIRVENKAGVAVRHVLDVLRTTAGVSAASASTIVPYGGGGSVERMSLSADGSQAVTGVRAAITPEFFATIDVPVRSGRAFTAADTPRTRTAIVNEALERRLFGGSHAVGRQVWVDGTPFEIVGLVADYLNNAFEQEQRVAKLYLPIADDPAMTSVRLLVRVPADPAGAKRALRREVIEAAAGNTVSNLYTLDEVIATASEEILAGTAPLLPLIATGMLLTTAGIYGVLAFAIARRSKELAVRVAIGASGRHLVQLVCTHSFSLVTAGTTIGVGLTFALSRIVRASGGGGSIFDPGWTAFVVPAAVVVGIGLIATWAPSRRAVRIDPAILLRVV